MNRSRPVLATALLPICLLAATGTASASARDVATDPPRVRLVKVADVDTPTAMATRAGDDTIYVAEQAGRVVAVRPGTGAVTPVLDLRSRIAAGGEQGLLGLVFSPDGSRLFVHFTNRDGNTRVEAYDVTAPAPASEGSADSAPVVVDRASRSVLLKVRQPAPNHNGGQLAFGPDGTLYLGLGDGGGADDEGYGHAPGGNGQSPNTLLGKIVRIDTDRGGGDICNIGLRNPWRFSFDRATGDLWIGDVGQDEWEEIDRLPAGSVCDNNLGWNRLEGRTRFRGTDPTGSAPSVLLVAVFAHERGFCSVIGGYVYRGAAIPDLAGWYVFADYCDGMLRALRVADDGSVEQRKLGAASSEIASFGEDGSGELFVLSQERGLLRVTRR